MTDPKILKAIAWLQEQIGRVEYGEIILTIVRHGKTTRLEKTIMEKEQVQG
jgi:hypothetical protein